MTLVGLSQRVEEVSDRGEMRDALDGRWTELLAALQMVAVPIPSLCDARQFVKQLRLDAILLTGGNDLGSLSKSAANLRRDRIDGALLDFAVDERLPLIGICRGAQFIASRFGSALSVVEGHVGVHHGVQRPRGALDPSPYGESFVVNSFHRYGITRLGEELVPTAIAPDGTVEAFRHLNLRISGMMWHPERSSPFQAADLQAFHMAVRS